MNQDTIPIVLKAFEAALKRDFPAFKDSLTPDCVMATTYPTHLPFGGESKGPEAVAEQLRRMSEPFEVLGADMREVLSQGDTVVLIYDEKVRAKATQKSVVNRAVAVTKVRDGKVASIRIFADTYAVVGTL